MLSHINGEKIRERAAPAFALKSIHPALIIAAIIALLPIANALIFATHRFPLRPAGLNFLFDLEAIYLVVELGVVMWAIMTGMSFRREFDRLDRMTRWGLLGFLATFWIGTLIFAPAPFYSAVRAAYWLAHIGFAFAVGHLLRGASAALIRQAMTLIAAAFLLLSVMVVVHLRNAPVSLTAPTEGFFWSAIAPGFLSIRQYGMLAGFVLACWLGMSLTAEKMRMNFWLAFAISALLFAALFWSGTRSALLGVGVSILFTLVFARKLPPLIPTLSLMVAAALGAYLSELWLPPDSSFGMFDPDRFIMDGSADLASGRGPIWRFGIAKFFESPIVGWGEGSFFQLLAYAGKGYHLHPHNFVIQFLMSWGIIAGGIALALMAKALWRLHWNLNRAPLAIAPLAALDCILVIAMLDGALFTLRTIMPAILFWIMAEKVQAEPEAAV